MAADKPPSRKHAVSVPAPFVPSEALTAIQVLLPRLEHWHVDDDFPPQEFCGWIAINQLKARTFGDLIRGLRPSTQTSSPFSDVYKLVSDQVWHGEPPEKAGTEGTEAADLTIALIQQPESLADRGKTLELLKDFSDRIEPRRDEADWKHLGATFDRLLKLPAYDGIAPPGNFPPGVSSNVWQVVGRNIQLLDSRVLADFSNAAVELVQAEGRKGAMTQMASILGARCPTSEADTTEGTAPKDRREEHPYRFECGPEIVRVVGLGEDVTLEKTEGVERLIAIVMKRRVSVIELSRIGSPQQGCGRSSVDVDADRLSERESANNDSYESRLGDDATSAVREAISDLIERRKRADASGDDQMSVDLTSQINAALQGPIATFKMALGTVKKSLDRTIKRIKKRDQRSGLASHFQKAVKHRRGESDYVYDPDESRGKIVWIAK